MTGTGTGLISWTMIADGYVSYTFNKAGTYYLLATEKDNAGKYGAAFSPATAKITVSESSTPVAVSSIEISAGKQQDRD